MIILSAIRRFFQTRDELSLINIRKELWYLLLIFPLTVILGDARYYDMEITVFGFESYELLLYPLGLGWLVLFFTPKRCIVPLLRIAAICCAVILPFQFLLNDEIPKLAVFMAFQFLNGICAASAFVLCCFKLNNIEKLLGIMLIIFYYGLYYTVYRHFPAVQFIWKTWGSVLLMAFYLIMVFILCGKLKENIFTENEIAETANNKEVKIGIVIAMHIVYYSIMCMINYLEGSDNIIYSMPFGSGQFAGLVLIIFILLILNRNSLYIWVMYLVFTLAGMSIVSYSTQTAHITGSFLYGLGDGLGYIILYYLCSGAIKKSKSDKVRRFFCLIIFIEYFIISGIFSFTLNSYEGALHNIALGVVLSLCLLCFLILPYLQKTLFAENWTDGLQLKNIPEYTKVLAETEEVNIKEHLDLTEREHEIFTMLLKGVSPKDIGYTLKISVPTVYFHRNNLYRKLGVHCISELFAKYGSVAGKK